MSNPCDNCKIRVNCDWLSALCPATPAEIARMPHLIKPMNKHQRYYWKTGKVKYRESNNASARRYRAKRARVG